MTTENGIPASRRVRVAIEVLRDRRLYLQNKMERRAAEGYPLNEYDRQEIFALEWALPVLEAEWDSIVRLRRSLGMTIGPESLSESPPKIGSAHGTQHALRPSYEPGIDVETHAWWCKCGEPLDYTGKRRSEASKVLSAHRRAARAARDDSSVDA